MISLRQVADEIGTTTCAVGPHTIALRMVPMLITESIGAAFPRPSPPMKKAVGGSLAPMEADYAAPAYLEAMQQRDNRIVAATVAWAAANAPGEHGLGFECGACPRGAGDDAKKWLTQAAAELMESMSMQGIQAMARALAALGTKADESAEKN